MLVRQSLLRLILTWRHTAGARGAALESILLHRSRGPSLADFVAKISDFDRCGLSGGDSTDRSYPLLSAAALFGRSVTLGTDYAQHAATIGAVAQSALQNDEGSARLSGESELVLCAGWAAQPKPPETEMREQHLHAFAIGRDCSNAAGLATAQAIPAILMDAERDLRPRDEVTWRIRERIAI